MAELPKLPELYSNHTNGNDPEPEWFKFLKGQPKEFKLGDTLIQLSRKDARLKTKIEQALVEVLINYKKEVEVEANRPLLGGNLGLKGSMDAGGNKTFGLTYRREF